MADNLQNNVDPSNINFDEMMKQAQEMQDKMKSAQDAIVNLKVVGKAGDDVNHAQVIMTGRHDVLRVNVSDNLKTGDKQILEDTVAAAFNDAVRKIEDETRKKMMEFAQSLKLPPGFQMPF